MTTRKVAIIGGVRIPFARSFGAYNGVSNQELLAASLRGVVDKYNLKGQILGEVVCGAVMGHSRDWNLAREATLDSGLSPRTPAYTVIQACGTSLETAILVGNKIALGQIDVGIAGGVETNSDLPVTFPQSFSHKLTALSRARSMADKLKAVASFSPADLKPQIPAVAEPRTGLSMGESCEVMCKTWKLEQREQDELALASHSNAIAAYKEGFFSDLLTPFKGLEKDNNVRETSLEKLASLKPVFDRSPSGTITAGNATPLTDGSAAVLMASEEWAKERGLPVLAYMTYAETAAVDFMNDEGLLMAPAYAVANMLKKANLKLQDFDFYEIHEAFAAQVLCTLKAWESDDYCRNRLGLSGALGKIDRSKLNVKGGSVALGHPFGATGARLIAGLAKLLNQKGSGRGLISICTGGGMGVTAILEK